MFGFYLYCIYMYLSLCVVGLLWAEAVFLRPCHRGRESVDALKKCEHVLLDVAKNDTHTFSFSKSPLLLALRFTVILMTFFPFCTISVGQALPLSAFIPSAGQTPHAPPPSLLLSSSSTNSSLLYPYQGWDQFHLNASQFRK